MTTTTFDWTAVAAGWDARRRHVEQMKAELSRRLVAGLRLAPGGRVLELGAGTGELALRLADAVGPTGHVLATDVAPGMVELIRQTVRGRAEVTVAVADATETGLPESSYDAVAFRMGLMLLPEPAQAIGECRRVLRDGGRLAVAVWDAPQHNPWLLALGMPAMLHGAVAGGPPIGPGGVFSLADADALQRLATGAGFRDVSVTAVPTTSRFATADEHFDTVTALAGPLSSALAAAPPETLEAVRRGAAEMIEPYRSGDGYVIPGQALLCVATA